MRQLFQLSHPQKRVFFTQSMVNEDSFWNLTVYTRTTKKLDFKILEESIHIAIEKNDAMRLRIIYENDEVYQFIEEYTRNKIAEHCFDTRQELDDWVNENSQKGFNLDNSQLYDIAMLNLNDQESFLYIKMHHFISDGWSYEVFQRQVYETYNKILSGETIDRTCEYSYINYLESEKKYLSSKRYDKDKEYWINKFNEYPGPLIKDNSDAIKSSRKQYKIPAESSEKIIELCERYQFSLNTFFISLISLYLNRMYDKDTIVLGTGVLGRSGSKEKSIVGMFANMMPLGFKFEENYSFQQLLYLMNKEIMDGFAHQKYPYDLMVKDLELSKRGIDSLYQVYFTYYNYSADYKVDGHSAEMVDVFCGYQYEPLRIIAKQWNQSEVITLTFDYKVDLYTEEEIHNIFKRFNIIIDQVIKDNEIRIDEIRFIDEAEEKLLLQEFNISRLNLGTEKVISELFEEQVENNPDQIALVFGEKSVTYRLVNERANALARVLIEKGVTNNEVVGIVTHRSLELVIGVLAILKAGAGYLPINPDFSQERINYILKDSGAKIILTQKSLDLMPDLKREKVFLEDCWDLTQETTNIRLDHNPNDLAYIIYTSGSTGKPKGVMIEQSSLVNLITYQQHKYPMTSCGSYLLKTTYTFDVSCTELFGWFFNGGKLVILESNAEKDIYEIINATKVHGITHINFVPSMLNAFLKVISAEDDLSSLQYVFVAGEAFPNKIANEFLLKLKNSQLINSYGPTEATIYTTDYVINEPLYDKSIVPIGKPIQNVQVLILDKRNRLQPVGVVGELCIAGEGLARGYTSKELTQENFVETYFCGIHRVYKTGDFAKWLPDGTIQYIGRKDNQVKIRGFRIELGEIEHYLLKQKQVDEGIVLVVEKGEYRELVAFVTSSQELKTTELREVLRECLPEYMIPTQFVQLEELPLNVNGKIDRNALLELELSINNSKTIVSPQNQIEEKLLEIWSEVLKVDGISTDDTFFKVGGHSLAIMEIISKVNKKLGVKLNFKDVIDKNTIIKMGKYISTLDTYNSFKYEEAIHDKDRYYQSFPLTEIQTAYLLGRNDSIELGNTSTHIYFELETALEVSRLNKSFQKVIDRHPMLRAIVLPYGEQKIVSNLPEYNILVEDLSHLNEEELQSKILKERDRMSHYVFQTDQWPLFEIKAFKTKQDKYYMFLGFDALIADGASLQILFKEWVDFYYERDRNYVPLEITFRDYVNASLKVRETELYEEDKQFWLSKIDDFPMAPNLPLLKDPSAVKTIRFKRLKYQICKSKWGRFKKTLAHNGVTPSVVFCTAFGDVLSFWSNQDNIAINMTVFNRLPLHKDINKLIGDFTSLLLIDMKIDKKNSFWQQAEIVQKTLFDAIGHRHFSGVEFIREITKRRELTNKAIMPVVFTSMINNDLFDISSLGEIKMDISQTTQVYLDHQIYVNSQGDLQISWDYVEELFDKNMIESMFEQYTSNLTNLVELGTDFPLQVNDSDKQLIEDYNNSSVKIKETTLHKLFVNQTFKTPYNVAVIQDKDTITYKELNEKSNQVAHYLRSEGVRENDLIGIIAKREIDTIINVLGILKAGAAYVPIEMNYPQERVNYILENSQAKMLLEPDLWEEQQLGKYSSKNLDISYSPDSLAYVIYTSGSTGRPKGVVITHKAVSNTVIDINNKFQVNERDRIIGLSSMCFDLSVYDIFGALSTGGSYVMVEDQRDMENVSKILRDHNITLWNSVPTTMDMLLEYLNVNVKEQNEKEDKQYNHKMETATEEDDILYWSPVTHWRVEKDILYIDDRPHHGFSVDLFPELYFLAQNGVTMETLVHHFKNIQTDFLKAFVKTLIKEKVLVTSILIPTEIFKSQQNLLKHTYPEETFFVEEMYEDFKKMQLNRTKVWDHSKEIPLTKGVVYPHVIRDRRSCRKFNEKSMMKYDQLSKFLSVLRQENLNGDIQYNYASAGGLYPIDVYIYIKAGRVQHLNEGLYLYSPINNSLLSIKEGECISDEVHHLGNKSIFNSSAFSIYLVYNADVTMPKYGGNGYFYACIDSGLIVGKITEVCQMLGMGICSIGDMDFHTISKNLNLTQNQVLIHSLEVGLKPGEEEQAISLQESGITIISNEESGVSTRGLIELETKKTSLRAVLLSGDYIPVHLPAKIKSSFNGTKVISLGGATEASIWSVYYPIEKTEKGWTKIPYGMPLGNQTIHVLNYSQQPCPVGVMGELYIGGIGVAKEYLKDEEKTKHAFIQHKEFGRLYRTGDYGILHKDGTVEFMGRKDHQLKIGGYRVELGEIEGRLLEIPEINHAVVADFTDGTNRKQLAAYVVFHKRIGFHVLREKLMSSLPYYMIPKYFLEVSNIPVNYNGKINRALLPKPNAEIAISREYVKPSTSTEEFLVKVWSDVLNVEQVSVNDSFSEIGANSLLYVQAFREIEKRFKGKIKIVDLFSKSTISKLAAFIDKK
ncbi:non-ribosomal peptide synthetase [Paenibacillus tyrfis]|uniref:non-ribosomal peptide synthetase n=1 Tax=Paenibacillus tyrfis TaxID=1501230 RepID=UPI000B5946CE|nr:non-ribosomal peptide synthetase [Paenibacillus tyrfis]